jgi:dienelactone hydrolase
MRFPRLLPIALLCLSSTALGAETAAPNSLTVPQAWLNAPVANAAPGFEAEKGVKAVFFDGPAFKGKPTTVFAWVGMPEKLEPGKKVPGIVLVHGGGGTAFAEWVRLWTSRGYAAIAMDNCGQIPRGSYGKWDRNPDGGPPGWGGFENVDEPREDQWPYHAVADVILAHSLLRSMPQVDADRIGITGISWGGYLTCIVAGLDERLKFAVPVYGCGFLGEDSVWKEQLDKMGDRGQKWLAMWDPKHYLPGAKMPMLWVTGTNDFAYPMDSLQKSYGAAPGDHTLCLRVRMAHGHGGAGENPKEILAFADSVLRGGPKLAKVEKAAFDGKSLSAKFTTDRRVVSAELNYTAAGDGPWQKREWKTIGGVVDATAGRAYAVVPDDARVFYLNLVDADGCVVSTEHVERAK